MRGIPASTASRSAATTSSCSGSARPTSSLASGMWKNDIIPHATKLKFVQSISSGMDQYSKELLGAKGIRLASAAGVNARAVAEHALALILAVVRRLPEARDNQHKKVWRGMLGDLDPARGRARRQDAADRRHGPHRQPSRQARQGLRHEGDRHPPRSQGRHQRRRRDPRHGRSGEAGARRPTSWRSPAR